MSYKNDRESEIENATSQIKRKYFPVTTDELKELLSHPEVKLADIDTSKITDMSFLFALSNRKDYSGIETWDVSNVKDMKFMFSENRYFNHPINSWNVKNVKNMNGMFYKASAFNQPLYKWDVSNVHEMSFMFYYALSFDQNIDDWNVKQVGAMTHTFEECRTKPKWYWPFWGSKFI